MEQSAVIHNTFVIERNYPKTPERVFASDFRVGGSERLRYRFNENTPFPGVMLENQESFLDILANRRIVTASVMTIGDRRISASLVTIELLPTNKGTRLVCTHQGTFFEGADGPQMREGGWQALLGRLETALTSPPL